MIPGASVIMMLAATLSETGPLVPSAAGVGLSAPASMLDKLAGLWPEVALFAGACATMVIGLSKSLAVRRLCGPVALGSLVLAGLLAYFTTPAGEGALPQMAGFLKVTTAAVGVMLVLLLSGTADREYERSVALGERFDPLRSTRAEFFSFVLFSLMGLMLCAGADDLIWLFLALELTSLPTYVMVSISTRHNRSLEAGVKYFFLGALGAATFLYGFALIYGGTGTTDLGQIRAVLAEQAASAEGINPIALTGLVLSMVGLGFKIAAVPMHFYTPDVYQGASATVSAFLAFVPKAAGFTAILLLGAAAGWSEAGHAGGRLPTPVHELLWVMAVLTMTVGNVLAVLQRSVKRLLAYSSIAHSGYMLVGVVAGPGGEGASFTESGVSAVLFYLLAYGVMNVGAFAVLACLEKPGADGGVDEIDDVDDLRGLCRGRPIIGYTMVLSALGLLGLPPTLGFFAKLPLFTSAINSGEVVLVVILGVNSAMAAFYYLRLAAMPWLEAPASGPSGPVGAAGGGGGGGGGGEATSLSPFPTRTLAGVLSAMGVVVLSLGPFTSAARRAGEYRAQPTPLEGAGSPALKTTPTSAGTGDTGAGERLGAGTSGR